MSKSEFNQPTLANKNLSRQLATVFSSHRSLYNLNDSRYRTPIIFELFSAIVNVNFCSSTDVLVVGTFVCILKTPPTADVVDQNCTKIRLTFFYGLNQLFQIIAAVNS